jgi:HAD superfamily hydrolase (TIGR01509 family)
MIRVVFFDVGGVLLEQDSTAFTENDREHCWAQGTSAEMWKAHLRVAHVDPRRSVSEGDSRIAGIRQRLYATNRVVPGVERVLQELQSRCRVAVIWNFTLDLNEVLDQLGLLPYFEAVINSSEVGTKKPDEKIYTIACQALRVHPVEAVLIDDSAENVAAARRLEMRGILFRSADPLRDDLRALGLSLGNS